MNVRCAKEWQNGRPLNQVQLDARAAPTKTRRHDCPHKHKAWPRDHGFCCSACRMGRHVRTNNCSGAGLPTRPDAPPRDLDLGRKHPALGVPAGYAGAPPPSRPLRVPDACDILRHFQWNYHGA